MLRVCNLSLHKYIFYTNVNICTVFSYYFICKKLIYVQPIQPSSIFSRKLKTKQNVESFDMVVCVGAWTVQRIT
jgi:hypothetical protein